MLKEIKKKYSEGALNKWEYIEKMYESHKLLFEYSDFLSDANISNIEIKDKKIIMTFRDSGIKMVVKENDARLVPLETLNFGSYEKDELQAQLKLIRPDDFVFDIGANFGWFSLHVAKFFPKAKIFSFEPIPFTYQCLCENIVLNNLNNIISNEFGLSEVAGTFDFYYDATSSGNASLKNVAEKKKINILKCRVQTLDEYVSCNRVKVDFIKCDVEGAELFAFKGGINTIKKHSPVIFAEMLRKWSAKFNYHPNDIIQFLASINYSCYYLKNQKIVKIEHITETTVQTNFFFFHNKKHLPQIKQFS